MPKFGPLFTHVKSGPPRSHPQPKLKKWTSVWIQGGPPTHIHTSMRGDYIGVQILMCVQELLMEHYKQILMLYFAVIYRF